MSFASIGQMRGTTVYCAVAADNCNTMKMYANLGDDGAVSVDQDMTRTAKTYNGKIIYSITFTEKYGGVDNMYFKKIGVGEQCAYGSWTTSETYSGKLYDYEAGSWKSYSEDAAYTVYFVNYYDWATPKAYAWNSACDNNAAYSTSAAMTKTGDKYNGHDIYSITFSKGYQNVIFNNNGSGDAKTGDLSCFSNSGKLYNGSAWQAYGRDITVYAIPEASAYYLSSFNTESHTLKANVQVGDDEWLGTMPVFSKTSYKYNGNWIYKATVLAKYNVVKRIQFQQYNVGSFVKEYDCTPESQYTASSIDGKIFGGWVSDAHTWYSYATDIAFDQQSGSGGTSSVTATVGSAMPAATMPTRAGYAFGGYYSAAGGSGDKYYNANGSSAANWIMDGPTTLYAKWTSVSAVPDDPDLDDCQVTGMFGLSDFSNRNLRGDCSGTTETVGSKDTRHLHGLATGQIGVDDIPYSVSSSRDHIHFEVWAPEAFTFTARLFGYNGGWQYSDTKNFTTTAGSWQSFDVALSAFTNNTNCFSNVFSGLDLSNLGSKDLWFANVYLYTSSSACAAEPEDAPSAPSYPACEVQSIYSDSYASVGISGYYDWGGGGSTKADRVVDGVNMYKLTVKNNFAGGFALNGKIDGSAYEYIHMDVWTPLASTFRFSPICWNYTSSGNETEQYKTSISTGAATWTSVDIPVSYFTDLGLTMRGNYQLKIDQCTSAYFWITNIYYYNTSSCPSYTPTEGTHHFGTAQRQNVALFSDADMATGRHANTSKPLAQHFDYYIVDCGDQMLAKTITRGKLGTGVYDQMVLVWNNAKTGYRENKLSQHNAAATIGFQRIGDADQYNWNGQTTTAPMNFYMTFQEQTTGTGYSEFFDYKRGYINNPNGDVTAPTLTSVASTSETGYFTLTFTGGNDNSGQWFYYIEDTEFDYYKVSLEDTIRIPKVDNGQVFHFNCYAVDFNGNMSAAKALTIEMPYTSPSTTNLALNRPVEMGVTGGTGHVSGTNYTLANDGSYSTRWEEGDHGDPPYSYTNEWWYVDLRGYYTLDKIKIWFETACTDNFVLQAAHTLPATVNDDTQWRTIYTNTSTPNTGTAAGNVNTYDVSGNTARYVRIKSYNNTYAGGKYGFSIWEFEVYGSAATTKDATTPLISTAEASALISNTQMQLTLETSDGSTFFRIIDNDTEEKFLMEVDGDNHVVLTNKTYEYCEQYSFDIQAMDDAANLSSVTTITPTVAPPALYNLTTGATATAGYVEGGNTAASAVDGNAGTRWGSNGGSASEHWITVDMKKRYTVSTVKLSWETACPKNYYLKASIDGTHFYPVGHYTTAPSTSVNGSVYTTYTIPSGIEARYLQMNSVENNTGYGTSIFEFEAYGSCATNGTKPIMTYAEIRDLLIGSTGSSAEINVGAWDDATAFANLTYKAVFTAGKDATVSGLTATDGVLTLSGLTTGTTYTVRIYAVDGSSNQSDNYKELTFTPKVNLYYLTGDATGAAGAWEGALGTAVSAATRRFGITETDGVYSYSITVVGAEQQYRLYYDVEGDITFRNDGDHWCTEGNQVITNHNGETITVHAKDKDHFVSNFDELYVYGAAVNAATEGDALQMTYSDGKFSWEGAVATGTNAYRIIVKNNGTGFNDHSRARIMSTTNWENSAGVRYAKLVFDPATWECEWTTADQFIYDNNNGAGNGNWSTAANWLNKAVPTIDNDVILQAPVTVDITGARAKSVVIDQSGDNEGQLIISAGKELVIAGTLRKTTDGETMVATGENDIIINSDASHGLGALVMGSHDGTNQATVNFYSISHGSTKTESAAKASVSQYVGTPFGNSPKMLNQFYNSWMYRFAYPDEMGNVDWVHIDGDDELEAFRGYAVISADPVGHTYTMSGALVSAADKTFNDLKCNISGAKGTTLYNNEHMFANSWMAPIKINQFEATDFVGATATIYIFNSGSPDDYENDGTAAGQYVVYPIETATDADVIPAMQAFSVYTYGLTGEAASLTLDYSRLVYDPAVTGTTPAANRAPRRSKVQLNQTEKMHVYVSAESGYKDKVYMLAHEDFSERFENGWDGSKLFGESTAPQLYALTSDGNMAINCVPTMEGTVLGFQKGTEDSFYTFSFDYDAANTWYLNDLKEQCSTVISAESTYTFLATDNDAARFIISRTPIRYMPTGIDNGEEAATTVRKLIIDEHVYIIRSGRMYDAAGALVR